MVGDALDVVESSLERLLERLVLGLTLVDLELHSLFVIEEDVLLLAVVSHRVDVDQLVASRGGGTLLPVAAFKSQW